MTLDDLATVEGWLGEPHVARWWTPDTTAEQELEEMRASIGGGGTRMCVVELEGRPVGWCQWYRWDDYPDEAGAAGARAGEVAADYALGDPASVGRGVGTAMVGAIVALVRGHHAGAGLLIAPEAANSASRRVLEKNGFRLVGVRSIVTEPHDRPMAIYRLDPTAGGGG